MLRFVDQESPTTEEPTQVANSNQGAWAGKPGQFSDKWLPQNAIDAVNKAGASLWGIKNADPNDMKLIENFYGNPENNAVLNQYDLNTNLFLRYLSGRGGEGLELSPEQGQKIFKAIKQQEQNIKDRGAPIVTWGGTVPENRKGHVPVYFGGGDTKVQHDFQVDKEDELVNSLGSFWAVPDGKGGYTIDEEYNFTYDKNNKKENYRNEAQQKRAEWALSMSLQPSNVGRRLSAAGFGKSFKYRLVVTPDGQVTAVPVQAEE